MLLCSEMPLVWERPEIVKQKAKSLGFLRDHWLYNLPELTWLLELCFKWKAASAARDVLFLGGDLHVSIYSVIYDKITENNIRCITTSPVSNEVARFIAHHEGEINERFTYRHEPVLGMKTFCKIDIGLTGDSCETKVELVTGMETKPTTAPLRKVLEDLVLCPICMQPIYKCVALMPCSHNFCMACCSEWMGQKADCPLCRRKIRAVMKNHPMDSVVEAYLVARPQCRRSDKELKDMEMRDTLRLGQSGKLVFDLCHVAAPGPASAPGPGHVAVPTNAPSPPERQPQVNPSGRDYPRRDGWISRGSQVCSLQRRSQRWTCESMLRHTRGWVSWTMLPVTLWAAPHVQRRKLG
eukprot:symbB.v1.2.020138.t1/scaffold1677.1/size106310/5